MTVLIFGDSNTYQYCEGHIEKYPGLMMDDWFYFLLKTNLNEDNYDLIIICIGTNDLGSGKTKEEIIEHHQKIKQMHANILIVGPYGDIDTRKCQTLDGIHLTDQEHWKIMEKLKHPYSLIKSLS